MSLLGVVEATKITSHHVHVEWWQWLAFVALISALLMFDLLVLHRRPHDISIREATIESAVWIAIGLSFALVIWWWFGHGAAGDYLAGYLIEESLSVDNVFVWSVILTWFAVPAAYQFRVLFWGVFGALVLRAVFIVAGVALVEHLQPVLYVFGAFLLYTAWKLVRSGDDTVDPESSRTLKLVRRFVPSVDHYDGQKLFTVENGKRLATPLFAVLVLIEATDVLFATDSIPAILAITTDVFIVFSSNAFAICGLRSLYFCLHGAKDRFRFLDVGVAVILAFVGIKLVLHQVVHFPTWLSLTVIVGILVFTILLSLLADRRSARLSDGT